MRPSRRLLTAGLLALGAAAPALVGAAAAPGPTDKVLGRANARVTVVEYASVTCPHCADWHETVWPRFKAKYVDSGKVRFVFRELTTEPVAWSNGGFMLARCAPADRYFQVISALFEHQAELFATRDYPAWLAKAGAAGGLTEAQAQACTLSEKGLNELYARMDASQKEHDVRSTPSFFVNDRPVGGDMAALEAAIEPLLRARR